MKLPVFLFTMLSLYFHQEIEGLSKTLKFDKFVGRCPGKDVSVYMTDIHLSRVQRMYYMSAKIVCTTDQRTDARLQLKMTRCKSKEAPDTCELYQTINVKSMCTLINMPFQTWSPFVGNIRPPTGCPMKKGVYYVTNGTFDGGALAALPIDGWYWKVEASILHGDEVTLCMQLEGEVVKI